jgi:short-subunit dehydrogenase
MGELNAADGTEHVAGGAPPSLAGAPRHARPVGAPLATASGRKREDVVARQIEGSVVVLTGASSGIGRATALALSNEGARLVLAARRADVLREVADECSGSAFVVPTDTTDPDAVDRLAEAAVERFGRIDTWINNASVGAYGRFDDVPLAAFRRLMDVNLFGYIHGTRSALKQLRRQGEGHIIQNASVVSRIPYPYLSAYVASKHAVLGFSLSLRQELALEGDAIQLSLVLPASIDTPFYEHAAHYGGVIPKVMPPVYPPEQVARTIVSVARRPRRQVFVGFAGKATFAQLQLAPDVTERQVARLAERMLIEHDPTAVDDGKSLFVPMASGRRATDGWQPKAPRIGRAASLGLVLLGGAVILVPGVGRALAAGILGLALGVGTSGRSLHEPTIEEVGDAVEARDLSASIA